MQNATIGLDLAKHVFQVHDVADDGKVAQACRFAVPRLRPNLCGDAARR